MADARAGARFLGVAQSTIRKWSDQGRVPPSTRPAATGVIAARDLEAFLERSGPGGRPKSGPLVLLVDDDEKRARARPRQPRVAGYTVREAGSADEGLAAIDEAKPDLVLLDVMMPQRRRLGDAARIQERTAQARFPSSCSAARSMRKRRRRLRRAARKASSGSRRSSAADRSDKADRPVSTLQVFGCSQQPGADQCRLRCEADEDAIPRPAVSKKDRARSDSDRDEDRRERAERDQHRLSGTVAGSSITSRSASRISVARPAKKTSLPSAPDAARHRQRQSVGLAPRIPVGEHGDRQHEPAIHASRSPQ